MSAGGSWLLRECLVGNIFVHIFGFDQPVDDVQNSRIVRIRLRIWNVCKILITACICPLPNFSFLLHLGHVKTQPQSVTQSVSDSVSSTVSPSVFSFFLFFAPLSLSSLYSSFIHHSSHLISSHLSQISSHLISSLPLFVRPHTALPSFCCFRSFRSVPSFLTD